MHEKVYSSVKLSYKFLGSEEDKSLLLLCSLYKEDEYINTNDLLKYGVGISLFDQGSIKPEDARNRVLNLVENLRTSSLLLEGNRAGYVKMHDVVRDVAVSIALGEKEMCSIRNVGELEVLQKKRKLESLTAISLLYSYDLRSSRFLCPKLLFLFMRGLSEIVGSAINSQLFEATEELQVLRLDFIDLGRSLPSFYFIQNLQTLMLRKCRLGDITWIGELRNLEILDLSSSRFREVPKTLGKLTRLLSLDLYDSEDLKVIQTWCYIKLGSIRRVDPRRSSFTNWVVEEVNGERSNASLAELKNLRQLTTLHLLANPDNLVAGLFTDKLERYALHIGPGIWCSCKHHQRYSRFLELNSVHSKSHIEQSGLKFLIKKAEELHMKRAIEINDVVPELDEDGFSQL
ncbi:hypothetical protein L484_007506 [Morus notabilis]|uniref:Disease resistance protein RPM1 n=1 Tax=Morus notabilis TaxID=981085 RepID=W9S2J0_9ROSA|nr:probable disease resistance protein At4g27220 [Morus notabilis]EXC22897.1 hypothetical protein L484_007506 [Morus notabilis]